METRRQSSHLERARVVRAFGASQTPFKRSNTLEVAQVFLVFVVDAPRAFGPFFTAMRKNEVNMTRCVESRPRSAPCVSRARRRVRRARSERTRRVDASTRKGYQNYFNRYPANGTTNEARLKSTQ